MKTPDTIEQEINRIRLRIYEETKNMTVQERVVQCCNLSMQRRDIE